jgi:hypothetical protein
MYGRRSIAGPIVLLGPARRSRGGPRAGLKEVCMVSILSLWAPILLSAVIVFVASSIIHMVLRYHWTDFRKIPGEDQVIETLRKLNVPPGDYVIPHAGYMAEIKNPEYIEKRTKGPGAFLTVIRGGPPSMTKELVLWFIYCVIIGIFAAYITGRALGPGAPYLSVFRFAGATAFFAHTVALWHQPIWYKRSVWSTLKSTFDGLIYALLTAGTFGWLWPS